MLTLDPIFCLFTLYEICATTAVVILTAHALGRKGTA